MEEKIKSITTLEELFSLLFTNKSNEEERDNFYREENLLPYLNYIEEHAMSLIKGTDEEHKWFYFYGITSRIKELYCGIGEFEKSLSTMKKYTNDVLEGFISKKYEFEKNDIPLVTNELISRVETNKAVDDLIYNVFNIIPTDFIQSLNYFQPFFYGEYYLVL